MQANRRVFASAIAPSGSSKAPGTGITVMLSRETPQASSSSSADSSSRVVTSPLKRETTIPTARRSPDGVPSRTRVAGRDRRDRPARARSRPRRGRRAPERQSASSAPAPRPRRGRPAARRRAASSAGASSDAVGSGSGGGRLGVRLDRRRPRRSVAATSSATSSSASSDDRPAVEDVLARRLQVDVLGRRLVRVGCVVASAVTRLAGAEVLGLVVPARRLVAVAHRGQLDVDGQACSGSKRTLWCCARARAVAHLVALRLEVRAGSRGSARSRSAPARRRRARSPEMPVIFFGLFVSTRIVVRPRSARICEPIPYSRCVGREAEPQVRLDGVEALSPAARRRAAC